MDWYGCPCFLINFKQISPATRMESKRLESPQTKWQWCVICCTISPPEVDSPVRASECTTLTPFWVWNAQTHSSFSACLRAFFFLKLSNIFWQYFALQIFIGKHLIHWHITGFCIHFLEFENYFYNWKITVTLNLFFRRLPSLLSQVYHMPLTSLAEQHMPT